MTLEDDIRRSRDAVEEVQARLWGEAGPPRDPTPIESGGAVLIVTLSPAEVRHLLEVDGNLATALHRVLDEARN